MSEESEKLERRRSSLDVWKTPAALGVLVLVGSNFWYLADWANDREAADSELEEEIADLEEQLENDINDLEEQSDDLEQDVQELKIFATQNSASLESVREGQERLSNIILEALREAEDED